MGKAAENEKRKLRAAYHNNIAVGLYVGGVILPLILYMPRAATFGAWFNRWVKGDEVVDQMAATGVVATFFGMVLAFFTLGGFTPKP